MKNSIKIFKKEIKEILINRSIWLPVLIISLIFSVLFPAVMTFSLESIIRDPDSANFITKVFKDTGNLELSFLNKY